MSATHIVHDDATLHIGLHKNVQINVWRDAPTLSQVRLFAHHAEAMSRSHPGGSALVNLVVAGSPRFSDGVRDEVTRMMKSPTLFRLGAAHVITLGGMNGVAVRAFLSTVTLVARPTTPSKVFGDSASAATWLSPRLELGRERWLPGELREAIDGATRAQAPTQTRPAS